MNARACLPLCTALVVAAALIGAAALRWSGAAREAERARAQLAALERDAREVLELRSARQRLGAGHRPAQDLIALVSAALSDAALPASRLTDLAEEADTALATAGAAGVGGGPGYRRQTIRLTLEPVTTPDLAAFLSAWGPRRGPWTIARIELHHAGGDSDETGRYSARLLLSCVYVDTGAPRVRGGDAPG